MKQFASLTILVALFVAFTACGKVPRTGEVKMKNNTDSISYALGYVEGNAWKMRVMETPFDTLDMKLVARSLAKSALSKEYLEFRNKQFGNLNEEVFVTAFVNQVAFDKSYFTEVSADVILRSAFEQQKKSAELDNPVAKENLRKGMAFLAENGKRAEVVTLPSGLQYEVMVAGKGEKPLVSNQVKCHYHGTLLDGKVFDSSVDRGEPAVFPVGGVIKGWIEALQLMNVGSKWKLFIPGDLAYGSQGAGNDIGPNETLIFEVELLSIE